MRYFEVKAETRLSDEKLVLEQPAFERDAYVCSLPVIDIVDIVAGRKTKLFVETDATQGATKFHGYIYSCTRRRRSDGEIRQESLWRLGRQLYVQSQSKKTYDGAIPLTAKIVGEFTGTLVSAGSIVLRRVAYGNTQTVTGAKRLTVYAQQKDGNTDITDSCVTFNYDSSHDYALVGNVYALTDIKIYTTAAELSMIQQMYPLFTNHRLYSAKVLCLRDCVGNVYTDKSADTDTGTDNSMDTLINLQVDVCQTALHLDSVLQKHQIHKPMREVIAMTKELCMLSARNYF